MQKYVSHADYDNAETFNKVLHTLQPFGFVDTSWHNDTCPSVALYADDETGEELVKIYIDFADPMEREGGSEMEQFCVYTDHDTIRYCGEDVESAINAALKAKG